MIRLTARFQREFQSVIDYIIDEFGIRAASDFTAEVHKRLLWIEENPEIGRIEPLLAERRIEYRCLKVGKHSKCIYYRDKDIIYVVDLWDMRREPSSLSARIRTKNKLD